MSKIKTIEEALNVIKDGDTILFGGFGLVGAPLSLIEVLSKIDVKELTAVSNNLGEPNKGLGLLLNQNKIKKGIGSYFISNRDVGEKFQKGEIELQVLPQGTLSEAIRLGGAGIPAFYTSTAQGTKLAEGKEERNFNGAAYILEHTIKGDVALIRAKKADRLGNLIYDKTARNFNPIMATAAKVVIAEVDEIVETGSLNPEAIITPHLFVDMIVVAKQILTKDGVKTR